MDMLLLSHSLRFKAKNSKRSRHLNPVTSLSLKETKLLPQRSIIWQDLTIPLGVVVVLNSLRWLQVKS